MYITVKITNAHLRGDWWHFKMNVPPELQKHYRKTAHTLSLETKDGLEAKKLADAKTAFFKAQHKQLRMDAKGSQSSQVPVSNTSTTQLVAVVDTSIIDRNMKFIDHVDKLSNAKIKLALNRCGEVYKQVQLTLQAEDGLSVESLRGISLRTVIENGSNLYELCEHVSGKQDLSTNEHLRNMSARATVAMFLDYITKLSIKLSSLLGVPNVIQATNLSQPVSSSLNSQLHQQTATPPSAQNKKTAPLLSQVLEECISEKKRGVKTTSRLRTSTALLIEWYGDKPISFCTRERMKSFIDDCLLRIPPNRNKSKEWRDYPLKEMVKKTSPTDVLKPDTVHNILSDLTTVFSYAVDEDIIFKHPTLKLSAKLPERNDDVDRSYSKETLKRMMELLTYNAEEPSRYWTVMLGLYTGARLNEVCQLHMTDVKRINGIDCICINIEDSDETFKRVKNKPSRRTVPIHPTLKKAGFLNFVKQRKVESPQGSLLFKELTYREESGYGRRISYWFARFKRDFKPINKYARGFHSLRHTFAMWAQNIAEMSDREILELTGHETKTISKDHRRYAHALTAKRLNTQLVKLDYGLPIPSNPYMES